MINARPIEYRANVPWQYKEFLTDYVNLIYEYFIYAKYLHGELRMKVLDVDKVELELEVVEFRMREGERIPSDTIHVAMTPNIRNAKATQNVRNQAKGDARLLQLQFEEILRGRTT